MSSTTTMGVRLDEATRERIKTAAQRLDRTPHWLIKQAIFNYLEQLDNQQFIPEISAGQDNKDGQISEEESLTESNYQPFWILLNIFYPNRLNAQRLHPLIAFLKRKHFPCYCNKRNCPLNKPMQHTSWLTP